MNDLLIYEYIRSDMGTGDHISWVGDNLLSDMIKKFTARTHSSIVFRPKEFGKLKDRRWIIEADQGEVNTRVLSKKLLTYHGEAYWHRLKPEYDQYRDAMENYLTDRLGDKYDYEGLFKNAFGHIKQGRDAFICSGLATACYIATIPRAVLEELLPDNIISDDGISRILRGEVLRPGEVATLPLFEPEVKIL